MNKAKFEELRKAKATLCSYCKSDMCEWCRVELLLDSAEEDLGNIEDDDEEDYIRSATNGDYSPSNPWGAPGCSIRDFI